MFISKVKTSESLSRVNLPVSLPDHIFSPLELCMLKTPEIRIDNYFKQPPYQPLDFFDFIVLSLYEKRKNKTIKLKLKKVLHIFLLML